MIRKYLLLMSAGVTLGLGPALAQDVFIKKNFGQDPDAPVTIFNKPKFSASAEKQSVVKYADRLNVQHLKAGSDAIASTLDEMREIGFKPSNAEEILLYANAHRAVSQSLMYERRKALINHLEKQEQRRIAQAEIANRQTAAFKTSGEVEATQTSTTTSQKTESSTRTQKLRTNRVFVRKSADEAARPTKVFQNYR